MDTLLAPIDLLPRTGFRIWGIDPSSKRIALAAVEGDGTFSVDNVRLQENDDRELRFADAYSEQVEFFKGAPSPSMVFLEEPFVPRDRRQVPTHLLMYGVTLAALGDVIGGMNIPVVELTASQWKAQAMGKGNGFAKKPQILEWARSIGYAGAIEDEADAIGVAIGGAHLFLSQERGRTAA